MTRRGAAICGTDGGYRKHLREAKAGVSCGPCAACRKAHSEAVSTHRVAALSTAAGQLYTDLLIAETADPMNTCTPEPMYQHQPNTAERTARDQLRILAVSGWSTAALSAVATYNRNSLNEARRASRPLSEDLLAAIDGAYQRCWWREGPSRSTATRARRAGWDALWIEPATGPVRVAS